MAQRIVGIDLGTHSVKVVIIGPKSRAPATRGGPPRPSFEVLSVGEVEVPPPDVDQEAAASLRDRQGEALSELKRRGLLDGDLYVTGLPGDAVALKSLVFPFNDREKIGEALPYTLESEITLDLDDVVFPFIHIERAEPAAPPPPPTPTTAREIRDAREKEKEPPPPKRGKESEVLVAYTRKDAVQDILDLLAVQGIDPRHIELDAYVLDDLWAGVFANMHDVEPTGPSSLTTTGGTLIEVADGAPEPVVALVDVGHRRTTVAVMKEGTIVSAHTLVHGGADATRALAKEIGLSLDEAERGKRKEAFIEVAGAVAQFPEQQQISDVLKKAHAPLVRRIRQIFQATISSSRLRVVKVVLTGGGSKVLNLDRYLAEELNIKVVRGRELTALAKASLKPAAVVDGTGDLAFAETALAFGYALSGLSGIRSSNRIDFRVGPFAWRGDYDFIRERVPALGAWAAALLLVVGVGAMAQAVMLSREETALVDRQNELCKQITGDESGSTSRCMALIKERINGTGGFQVPEYSAVDTFVEISRRLPYSTEIKRKITELDITSDRVRLKGTTTTYEAIDTMVARLQGGKCFSLVDKGKARNINAETVEMNITITLDCSVVGDGKVPEPPPAPTAASLASSDDDEKVPTDSKPDDGGSDDRKDEDQAVVDAAEKARLRTEAKEKALAEMRARKSSPEEIEARKERLRKLREERDARRRQLLDNPVARPNIRNRFQKPIRGLEGDERDEADEGEGDE